jgi:hypothetical protein
MSIKYEEFPLIHFVGSTTEDHCLTRRLLALRHVESSCTTLSDAMALVVILERRRARHADGIRLLRILLHMASYASF